MGAPVENYVAQSLVAQGHDLLYWTSKGKAEIDFVIEGDSAAGIPVEVKSSRKVRSKSLSVYREKYKPARAIRLSEKNFGFEGGIKSIPLYAAFCEMGHE